jgi:hypothetical protein
MYALAALKNKRSTIASEIVQLERQLRHRKELLVHVDATLKLLGPSIEVEAIPNKRPPQRVHLFRSGELGRLIIDAIRRADRPVRLSEIVDDLLRVGGHDDGARRMLTLRVRSNLAYQVRQGKVRKEGDGRGSMWHLC